MSTPRRRLSLRREVLLLLAGALLVLILVSSFTLFAYASALDALADERRAEAARLAGALAESLSAGRLPTAEEVARLVPGVRRVAVVDPRGRTLSESGAAAHEEPVSALLAPLGEERARTLSGPIGLGPGGALGGIVAGFAPVGAGGERRYLRVDLPAGVLAPQLRGVRVLAVLVLAVNGALAVLLALFLRQLVRPFDRLVERARELSGGGAEEDEAMLLRGALERAFASLATSPEETASAVDDDISALRRTLGTSLESGVVLIDRDGSVVALNQIGSELLGVAPPAPGTDPSLEEAFARYPELVTLLADAVAGRRGVSRRELEIDAPAGRLTLGITAHPLRRDDGGIRGHLVLFADLTEIRGRARREQLAESLAGLGELAAGVAHELRNSLATLNGYLTLIERSPDEESITDYLGEIRHETDHLERVLEDFLAFARPGTARVEAVDLLQIVHRAVADPALPEVPLAIRDERAAPIPILGDPQLLERALRNLLHNAAAAVREAAGGSIEVVLISSREGQAVAVDDDGPGLSPEIRAHLFQPFVTGRSGGVGLGLAISRRIVDLHGGSLELLDRPGGGTRALIRFAADAFVTKEHSSTAPSGAQGGDETP